MNAANTNTNTMSEATKSGLDLSLVPIGATLAKVVWVDVRHYCTQGDDHESFAGALREGVERQQARTNVAEFDYQTITIDQRATFSHPEGGSTDMVALRTTFPTLTDALNRLAHAEHIARAFARKD